MRLLRLFVAAIVPPEVSRELNKVKQRLERPGVKTTPDSHLTLAFLGETEEAEALRVRAALRAVLFKAMALKTDAVKVLPSLREPERVELRLLQNAGSDELCALQKKISAALKEIVAYEETRSFTPHITLARIKFIKDRDALDKVLRSVAVPSKKFRIDKFYLLRSVLTSRGPIYELLETYAAGND